MRCLIRFILPISALALVLAPPALSFHDAGVAHCNGCHAMHASAEGMDNLNSGNDYLLKQSNSTDVCISCHNSRLGNIWDQDPMAPGPVYGGGNFVFLEEDNLNDGHAGASNMIPGHQAGHSVISVDKGVGVDPVNGTAPGGTYNSNNLRCSSCHDPHGRGAHFRLLYGNDFPDSRAGGVVFNYTQPAPTAQGISFFGGGESNTNHTAYQAGMTAWCANCHGDYHNTNYPTTLKHPTGVSLGPMLTANYNMYEGSGHYTGDGSDAYEAMVPVESQEMTTDYAGAITSAAQVMCLTCHRAHATSAPDAGRWDFNITLWEEEGLESGSYKMANPYEATAGDHQRSLCNKCHAKDPV